MTRRSSRSSDTAAPPKPPQYPGDCFWFDSTGEKCELRALLARDDTGQIERICVANSVAVEDMKRCVCTKSPALKSTPTVDAKSPLRKALSRHLR